ncbi:hypothetical protein ACJD0Z_07860 [Flavobacteriaceae bacterium M23B6Z8]
MIKINFYHLKNFVWKTSLAITLLLFASCSNDSNDDITSERGRVNLAANVIYDGTASASGRSLNASVLLSEFKVNLEEIEFEVDEDYYDDHNSDSDDDDSDWDDNGTYDFQDDIELEGPFEIDILSGQVTFANFSLPNAIYEEIEFEFNKNQNPSSDLFNKTVLIRGTIDDIPFEFWTAFEEEFELDYEDASKDIVVDSDTNTIVITFNLDALISVIDFSAAKDGNEDGLIEIYNNDPDGNDNLADQIKNKLKDYIDLLDD